MWRWYILWMNIFYDCGWKVQIFLVEARESIPALLWGKGFLLCPLIFFILFSFSVLIFPVRFCVSSCFITDFLSAFSFWRFCMHAQSLSCVSLLTAPWTINGQTPLSLRFPKHDWMDCQAFPPGLLVFPFICLFKSYT